MGPNNPAAITTLGEQMEDKLPWNTNEKNPSARRVHWADPPSQAGTWGPAPVPGI
jgi:hypothetical protein